MKLPKIFRKEYTEKKFRKKILGRIHIPEDRKYLASLFKKRKDTGTVYFAAEPDKKEMKRIQSLAKSIRKNKGLFVTWKLALVLIIAGSIIVFGLIFKNPLIEGYAEKGIERIFGAGADIQELKVSFLTGRIEFSSLEIQNEERPDKNIIETGPAVLQIDINQAFKRRLRIIEMSIDDLMTGTATSLPPLEEGEQDIEEEGPNEQSGSGSAVPGIFTGGIGDYDFRALLEEQRNNLAVYKELEDMEQDAAEIEEKWTGRLEDTSSKIENISATATRISSMNLSNTKDLNKVKDLQGDIEESYSDIRELRGSVSDIRNGISADKNRMMARKDAVQKGFSSDYEYMASFIDLPVSEKLTAAADIASAGLGPKLQQYYSHLKTGIRILNTIRGEKEEKEQESVRRYQEFIQFPGTRYPGLLIEEISAGFGGEITGEASAEWISSDPPMVKEPTRISATAGRLPGTASVEALADLRNETALYSTSMEIGDRPVLLNQGLEGLQIESLTGMLSGRISVEFSEGIQSGTAAFTGRLSQTEVSLSPGSGAVRSSIESIFSTSPVIDIEGSFDIAGGEILNLQVSSSFDDLLSDEIGRYIREEADKLRKELRSELNAYSRDLAAEYGVSNSFLNEESAEALSQIRSVEEAEQMLDEKKAEAENALKSLTGDGLNKLKDNLKLPGF